MRFSPQFLDDIRTRLPVSQVVGRKVALKKAGREWRGLSPFKQEKTPSFFVNDQKGFYHCFASGEHGDIFTFLIKTEGLSFPEAVERLAGEAGLQLPAPVHRDPKVEDERERLSRLLEVSARFFHDALFGNPGRQAREYIERRGLKLDTLATFRIGYAPPSRNALKEHLAKEGFSVADMITSGMVIGGEDIATPYDRFRDRVMFPIRDMKGHVIAFGGRALDPDQPAKYLNSPETPLFHKGRVLFNFHNARQPAFERDRLLIVEGYMDVLALFEAGFEESVAPLGTALTADQMGLLWRVIDEPVLCFDGDNAGRKAAWRAIDTALPLVQPGKSLTFAFLPEGMDPDDLVRAHGKGAFDTILARARPMIDVLFEREWSKGDISTPERRARLEQQLSAAAGQITDTSIRGHYQRELKSKLWQMLRKTSTESHSGGQKSRDSNPYLRHASAPPGRHNSGARRRGDLATGPLTTIATPSAELLKSSLVTGDGGGGLPHREALLLATLLNHPNLIDDHAETLSALELTSSALSRLRDGLLSVHAAEKALDRAALHTQLTNLGLDQVLRQVEKSITHRCDKFADPETGHDEAEAGWRHTLELHHKALGLSKSLEAAERDWLRDESEEAFNRIQDLKRQMDRLETINDAQTSVPEGGPGNQRPDAA